MTNKKIAFVGGTGPEGIGLALRMATVGHEIMIGSRTDERGKEVAERILEHFCFELNALCYGLASSCAVTKRPCAYLVLHLCAVTLCAKWHLGFT